MKLTVIRKAMETHLAALGFSEGSWSWVDRPNILIILVGGQIRHLKLKAGMPKWQLVMEMGRAKGWAEVLGIEPKRTPARHINGAGAHMGEQLPLLA